MSETLTPLVADLVEWVSRRSRPYAEVLDAWRTACPRLPVWEDAVDRGLVVFVRGEDGGREVVASEAGLAFLRATGRIN
jgi:hypothetical protein